MPHRVYPSDLSDAEWAIVEPLLPAAKPGGRPRSVELRAVCNAILYLVQCGCPWRYLPQTYPPHQTVYTYFRQWRDTGVWQELNAALAQRTRVQDERQPTPSAAIIDSQSVPMHQQPGERGDDGHKRVKGHKRHIMVDTLGLLLAVVVLSATVGDRAGAQVTFQRLHWRYPRLRHIWADGGYSGTFVDWVAQAYGWVLEIVASPIRADRRGRMPIAKRRWVVERTFAWFDQARRLTTDYETHPSSHEALCYARMVRLMLRRLA
jgi:putative transposase